MFSAVFLTNNATAMSAAMIWAWCGFPGWKLLCGCCRLNPNSFPLKYSVHLTWWYMFYIPVNLITSAIFLSRDQIISVLCHRWKNASSGKSLGVVLVANFFMRCLGMCLYACFSGFVKLWSSLTLRATFADIPCILRVLQVRMREICVSTNK